MSGCLLMTACNPSCGSLQVSRSRPPVRKQNWDMTDSAMGSSSMAMQFIFFIWGVWSDSVHTRSFLPGRSAWNVRDRAVPTVRGSFRCRRQAPFRAAFSWCGFASWNGARPLRLPYGYGNVEQPHAPQRLYGYHTGVSDRGDSPAGKRSDYGHPDEGGRCGT